MTQTAKAAKHVVVLVSSLGSKNVTHQETVIASVFPITLQPSPHPLQIQTSQIFFFKSVGLLSLLSTPNSTHAVIIRHSQIPPTKCLTKLCLFMSMQREWQVEENSDFSLNGSICVAGIVKMDISSVIDSAVRASRAARN